MFAAQNNRPVDVAFPSYGICIFEAHHGPAFQMPTTRTQFLKVVYVLKGRGKVADEKLGRTFPIGKGDLVVVPPGAAHAFHDDASTQPAFIVLCVRSDVFKNSCPAALLKLNRPRVYHNHALKGECDPLLRRLFFEQILNRAAQAEMMVGLTIQLLATIARVDQPGVLRQPVDTLARSNPEARVQAYIRDLEERYFETEKIDNVATRLGMSRRSFTTFFRKLTGKSWLHYVRDVRLRFAKTLLLNSESTVLWVAMECGFQDLSTFYRTFRSAEGLSPEQWKKAYRMRRQSPGVSARRAGVKLISAK